MTATIFLLLFMLLVPTTLKKTGTTLLKEKNKKGIHFIVLSKALWWGTLIHILSIWFPQHVSLIWILCLPIVIWKSWSDRNKFKPNPAFKKAKTKKLT